jgi:D-ribose pyranose/furanose isomerase RbsD
MKKGGIYHPRLNYALATLGHGDILFVSDGGYPTPVDDRRVDLAIAPNLPELRPILVLLKEEIFIEKIIIASEMEHYNPLLYQWLLDSFSEIEIEKVPHKPDLAEVAKQSKWFVRTGAMDPWGNIALVGGVNWDLIMAREGVNIPSEMISR